MHILGIDPGTAIVGWGVIKETGGKLSTPGYGAILTPAKTELSDRLVQIERELSEIIERYRPEEASVEELFFFNNQKTAIAVAQARGVILLTLSHFNVKIYGYTPLQVKQALTGYGGADKRQMQLMTKSVLHLSDVPKPDDTADALALGVCHASARKMRDILK